MCTFDPRTVRAVAVKGLKLIFHGSTGICNVKIGKENRVSEDTGKWHVYVGHPSAEAFAAVGNFTVTVTVTFVVDV